MIPSKRHLARPGEPTKENLLQQYSENFKRLGCLGPPVHLEVKAGISPVQKPIHRVSKHMEEKEAPDRYVAAGIKKKVKEPTSRCFNEVVKEIPKTRICIDPSQIINEGTYKPVYQMPTLSEELQKLCHAREGLPHVPFDEEKSLVPTMYTSCGRYLSFNLPLKYQAPRGVSDVSSEGLEGVLCMHCR